MQTRTVNNTDQRSGNALIHTTKSITVLTTLITKLESSPTGASTSWEAEEKEAKRDYNLTSHFRIAQTCLFSRPSDNALTNLRFFAD